MSVSGLHETEELCSKSSDTHTGNNSGFFFRGFEGGHFAPPQIHLAPPELQHFFKINFFFNTKAIKRDKYSSRLSSPISGFSSIVKAFFFPLHDRLLLRLLAFNSQYF